MRGKIALLSLTAMAVAVGGIPAGAAAASATTTASAMTTAKTTTSGVTTSSLGNFTPTFTGPAATGCDSPGCSLLTGPFRAPSTASLPNAPASTKAEAITHPPRTMPLPMGARRTSHVTNQATAASAIPSVSCQPQGPGCDTISGTAGGANGVKGLNAVDSGTLATNILVPPDVEPPDQGLCAGNGSVVEDNNIGEIMVFNTALKRRSGAIPLDTLMGLTGRGFSSGGDPSCVFDQANGGHWFFTEFVSTNSEASGGPFTGCFASGPAAVANSCLEGIAVTTGDNPFGPYNVYFLHADYNPAEPGYPFLLNDFVKISTTQDAFLLFYDEFPQNTPGIGGGGFNGSQEFAFSKTAMELGLPATLGNGKPDPFLNVAIENTGLIPTPDGTCASDNTFHLPSITCWFQTIPAQAPDPSQYDNSHGGSGFMLSSLDFYGNGDNRFAVFDWTGLRDLNRPFCVGCAGAGGIGFGGQLFSGVDGYFDHGTPAAQKAGPIPLGDECGAAGLSTGTPPPASCPEGGIATNGDGFVQVTQAQDQIWGATATEVNQSFASEASPELHNGAAYYVVGTGSFDRSGSFGLTSQGYVSAAHEELEFPSLAAEGAPRQDGGNNGAIMDFTLSGNGGATGADNGGFFPSSAFGRLTSTSGGLLRSRINIVDLGQSPQDGQTEYFGFPGQVRPRWGDYSWALFVPGTGGRIYFANEYIQSPNCLPPAFTNTVATCGGTRDALANWGTAVNSVVP